MGPEPTNELTMSLEQADLPVRQLACNLAAQVRHKTIPNFPSVNEPVLPIAHKRAAELGE
jgi:hypothetical protein